MSINTVSVVIPTFNRISMLPRAIDSVLKQTMNINEVILVDDGSTDGSVEMIRQQYPTVVCIVQNRKGVSAARNIGIRRSKSTWVAFLDSDDAWVSDKIEKQIKKYEENKCNSRLIHTDEVWYKDNNFVNQKKRHKKAGGNIFLDCLPLCCISPSSSIIRSDLFKKIGYFDESLPVCEDYDFWLRITSKESVLFVEEPLTIKFGGHQDQLSIKYWGIDRFRIQALQKLLDSEELCPAYEKAALNILIEKINILINGAKKRKNYEIVNTYSKQLEHCKSILLSRFEIGDFLFHGK